MAALVLAAALAAGGCGGGDDDPIVDPTVEPTVGPTTTTPAPTPTTQTSTPKPKPKPKNIIAWILGLGPGAPSGPPEFTAYRELQTLQCSRVFDRVGELDEPARTLYTGAAQACLAAFKGDASQWPKAEAAYDEVRTQEDELSCMDLAVLGALEQLVTAHADNPSGSFVQSQKGKWTAPPCPSISRVEPDHGVQGTVVTLFGRHLDEENVDRVEAVPSDDIGGLAVGDLTFVEGGVQFTMPEEPRSEASRLVCLVVVTDPNDWRADGAFFRYDSEDDSEDDSGEDSGEDEATPEEFACPKAES